MTKGEAAQILNVSTRAIERYVKAGRLTATYTRGATGRVLDLDSGEVARLKAELDAPPGPTQAATTATSSDAEATAIMLRSNVGALARRQPNGGTEEGAALVQVFTALLEEVRGGATRQGATPRVSVPIEAKFTLSIEEAAALSGLSQGVLRTAIRAGELEAKRIGRGYRIRRESLASYLKEVFK